MAAEDIKAVADIRAAAEEPKWVAVAARMSEAERRRITAPAGEEPRMSQRPERPFERLRLAVLRCVLLP